MARVSGAPHAVWHSLFVLVLLSVCVLSVAGECKYFRGCRGMGGFNVFSVTDLGCYIRLLFRVFLLTNNYCDTRSGVHC